MELFGFSCVIIGVATMSGWIMKIVDKLEGNE